MVFVVVLDGFRLLPNFHYESNFKNRKILNKIPKISGKNSKNLTKTAKKMVNFR